MQNDKGRLGVLGPTPNTNEGGRSEMVRCELMLDLERLILISGD